MEGRFSLLSKGGGGTIFVLFTKLHMCLGSTVSEKVELALHYLAMITHRLTYGPWV